MPLIFQLDTDILTLCETFVKISPRELELHATENTTLCKVQAMGFVMFSRNAYRMAVVTGATFQLSSLERSKESK